jgi:hypothetical protein
MQALEINGCNEISEQGLWSALQPRLVSLTVTDCINVADECICAITQLLPALNEFNLQVRARDSGLKVAAGQSEGDRLHQCGG